MLSVRAVLQWPTTSHARAVANAREASVRAARARVERAEVEAYLASITSQIADHTGGAGVAAR